MSELITAGSLPFGDFRAGHKYSKYLGVMAQRLPTLRTGLCGKLPETADPQAGEMCSTPGMPVVQAWNLMKENGFDRVPVDMVGRFTQKPIMNDANPIDKSEALKYARDGVRLSLYTHPGNPGGIMTRQRNIHNTRMDVMSGTLQWLSNLDDNLFMIHAAGARGHEVSSTWIVPLETDPEYQDIVGNSDSDGDATRDGNAVLPPSRTRYTLPGNATGLDDIDTTDTITLDFLTRIRARINTSEVPIAPINSAELKGQANPYGNGNSRLLVGFLSEEQYVTLKTATGDTAFTRLINDANTRVDFNNHPTFADLERFLWAGIIWFKSPRTIRFTPGMTAQQYNATTGVLETVTVNAALPATSSVHRGFVLGAQALGVAYGDVNRIIAAGAGKPDAMGSGRTDPARSPYSWAEDVRAGGQIVDIYGRVMQGWKKLRYTWNGVVYDNGVHAFDTYQAGL